MANKKNKVKFNICNVHYAKITVTEEGEVTFAIPVAMPGAVSISMSRQENRSLSTQMALNIM